MYIINYLIGEEMIFNCNVLVEVVCIVCGEIKVLIELNVDEFDVLIVLGGFGVVKNLFDFVVKGVDV